MQFLSREEKREKIYSPLEEGQKTKKRNRSISRTRIYPLPGILQKNGIRFTNQRRRGDKKEDRRPEEDHGQEGALASLSRGSFSDRIPIFFFVSLAQNGCLLQREEKKRDQKTNQKSATFASSRLCAFVPKNRPFDAVKRAHRTPKCTGSTSVRALTPQHPSRAGREEVLSSGKCVRKTKVERDLQSFFHRERSNAHPQLMGKKTRGRIERDFVFGPILIFFVASKSPKNTPKTDHIFFFFTQTLNNVLWVAPFCYVMLYLPRPTTDDAGQKNDDGQKDDGEEEGGSDQTSQD